MSLINSLSRISLAAMATFGLLACGDDGGGSGNGNTTADAGTAEGDTSTYVLDTVVVPENANQATGELGQDLNDDGIPDNALGGLLGALASTAGLDLQTGINDQLDTGSFILLAGVQATALTNANNAGFQILFGENPSPAACTDPEDLETCRQHFSGSAMFDVAADSPSDAKVVGNIAGGNFTGGPGTVSIQLPLGGQPLSIDLIAAHVDVDVTEGALMSGKLGGALKKEDVDNVLMPAIQELLVDLIEEDCTGEGDDCGCEAGGSGAQVLNFFDSNDDCEIPLEELNSNSLIEATVRNPDLDLLDENGNFNPGADGVVDSLSLGVGFTGVSAQFTP